MIVSFPSRTPPAAAHAEIRPAEMLFQHQPVTVIQMHETRALIAGPDLVGSEKRQRIVKIEYLEPRPAANA